MCKQNLITRISAYFIVTDQLSLNQSDLATRIIVIDIVIYILASHFLSGILDTPQFAYLIIGEFQLTKVFSPCFDINNIQTTGTSIHPELRETIIILQFSREQISTYVGIILVVFLSSSIY